MSEAVSPAVSVDQAMEISASTKKGGGQRRSSHELRSTLIAELHKMEEHIEHHEDVEMDSFKTKILGAKETHAKLPF